MTQPFAADLLQSGPSVLDAVCDTARKQFGCDLALVGSLRVAESERIFVEACAKSDNTPDLAHYDICPAPCRHVLENCAPHVHLRDLSRLYPDDLGIRSFESESYVGYPLLDSHGAAHGIIVLEWRRSLTQAESEQIVEALAEIAPRLSTEVANLTATRALEALVAPGVEAMDSDVAIFRTIALQAAQLAQVKSTFLAKCVDSDPRYFRILACVVDGLIQEDAEGNVLEYEQTPCRHLRHNAHYLIERDLQVAFPDRQDFREAGMQAYFGFGFQSREGRSIGHLAFLHDRPLSPRILRSSVLTTVSNRARQELTRYIAVSEREALEQALLVRKKLDSLGLMAGSIAHDFNNQLSAMIGHTELARLELPADHPAAQSLAMAEDSMWRARDVVGELMDFAGNTPRCVPQPLNLNTVVENAVTQVQGKGRGAQGPTITVDLAPDLAPMTGRAGQMAQIMTSLLANAREATRHHADGGHLHIRTANAPVPVTELGKCLTGHAANLAEGAILLEISDNGHGMDPETAQKVFDPFFSTRDQGRGLGLAGVLGIARRMKASLILDSAPNIGTTLRLFFPAHSSPPKPAEADPPSSPAPVKTPNLGTLLVVDDEAAVLDTVTRQLKHLGYDTLTASSGTAALEWIDGWLKKPNHLDGAVIDVAMPGLDGWQTLQALRDRLPSLPAVIVSGYNQSDAAAKLPDQTPTEVLIKPFALEELRQALESVLRNKA